MTPEQIIGKWAERIAARMLNEAYEPNTNYAESSFYDKTAEGIALAELQLLADLIRAAQEIQVHLYENGPVCDCDDTDFAEKIMTLRAALEKLGSICGQ
jgi:hypothetical protein